MDIINKKRLLFSAILVFLVVGLLVSCKPPVNGDAAEGGGEASDEPKITVVPPTCLEDGYSIYEENGKSEIKDVVAATGHSFGNWTVVEEAFGTTVGLKERSCQSCGIKESESFYKPYEMATLHFEGDISGASKTRQVMLGVNFSVGDLDFEGYASVKMQGHTSLQYNKTSYTVKFFEDECCRVKAPFAFYDWNSEYKFILKANYTDTSRVRNLICSDLWSQMVDTREGVHDRLLETSNNGAVDGFPVEVYVNDEFFGLYNLTLHKDDDLFDMKEGREDGIVIMNDGHSPEALFQQTIDWSNSRDWEVEYWGTEDVEWIQQKLNCFIEFVINSSDEEFKNELSKHADVNSLIDYIIAIYTFGLNTSYAKDLIFATYDNGVWIASLFDMEDSFGFIETRGDFDSPDKMLPYQVDGVWQSGNESLLWNRFINLFYEEIAQRYRELRKDVLSEEYIMKIIDLRLASIPEDINRMDMELYPNQLMQGISHSDQIKSYVRERLILLDEIFDN